MCRRRRLRRIRLRLRHRCRGERRRYRVGRFAQLLAVFGDQALESLLLQPGQQHVGIGPTLVEGVRLGRRRDVVAQLDQSLGDARQLGVALQRLAPLGLLDLAGPCEQRLEVAVLAQQLGRGLDADAWHTRHVVGRIAGQRLHVDDLVRRDAELLHHRLGSEPLLLDRVEHLDARPDELHQVLVGRHDGAGAAGLDREPRIGRDQVVGLVVVELADGDVERLGRLADQRELRDQVFRRLGPVGLVLVVDLVAEGGAAGVEDHRDVIDLGIVEVERQHAAEAVDRVDRRAVGPRHRRQRVVGAEQVARAVNQPEMLERLVVRCGRRRSRRVLGFRHAQGLARSKGPQRGALHGISHRPIPAPSLGSSRPHPRGGRVNRLGLRTLVLPARAWRDLWLVRVFTRGIGRRARPMVCALGPRM